MRFLWTTWGVIGNISAGLVLSLGVAFFSVFPSQGFAVVVVAHAGGKAHAPENTLPAISASFDAASDWVEVDVRLTADAVAMLMHDMTVDRTTDGSGLLLNMTFAEVKILDAGSYFAPEFAGTEVPTFQEALAVALGRGPLLIDMKDSFVGVQLAQALSVLGATSNDVAVWATSVSEITEAQTFVPGAPIFFQTTNGTPQLLEQMAALEIQGVSILDASLDASLVDLGHSLGLDIYVWGANGTSQMARALFYGVDGIHHTDPAFVLDFISTDDCSDGGDNDQDGFADFPDDPGCSFPADTSEKSAVPCDDGIDNDGDGLVDFPYDPGCTSLLDGSEDAEQVPALPPFGWMVLVAFLIAASARQGRPRREGGVIETG